MGSEMWMIIGGLILLYLIIKISKFILRLILIIILLLMIYIGYCYYIDTPDSSIQKELIYDSFEVDGKFKF